MSAAGTYSPMHYDCQDSYLCQVRGHKRLLLWPETALDALQPYPEDHHLARRLQVDPRREHEPARWESDAQRAAAATPLEARLAPGDVVYFPSRWAHYTEALPAPAAAVGVEAEDAEDAGLSFSLGFRTDGEFLV